MDLTDTRYEVENGLAWITIDRPDRMNAFRAKTVDELIRLFTRAWASPDVGVICLTGAGDRAFCAGGDQKQRAETGDYGPSESGLFEIERLHRLIRDVPKPVIAAVNGVAIGGGHVLHVLCDVTIAAEDATFGQVGPRVGSFDGGFGTAYLARVVGEKRAREIWFRCRRYDAADRRAVGTGQPGRAARRAARRGSRVGRRHARAVARPRCGSSSSRSTPTPSTSPASPACRSAGSGCSTTPTSHARACRRSTRTARRTTRAIGPGPRPSRAPGALAQRGSETDSISPGKRCSRSSRRSQLSRVVPSSR